MTDAHAHVVRGEARHLLCEPAAGDVLRLSRPQDTAFLGCHPWLPPEDPAAYLAGLRARLAANPAAGIGEIGLDRLRCRTIPPAMREIFASQLLIAAEFRRPAVLHGAKCWGETVSAIRRLFPSGGRCDGIPPPPALLFHGFSRAAGLLPEIAAMNGFVSVGPAVLNDHACNYRELVRQIPAQCLLAESDATAENASTVPPIGEIVAAIARVRGVSTEAVEALVDANADRFTASLGAH